ncbi:dienelactone hydrolase family protein [Nakamurella endophytica]|uniref:Dienelactone hydrolase domain-containing protein n=1 Tax=Nakamurella endophytica TaxID=1748367 RepID=A0A917T4Q6_9ACTN|nr:dienelactone hydrolase family protein [Nakamurella endophytica]GGM09227.1 hypothetical protein GCM10011594_31420 [Nakamurella endophytica]
MVDENAEHNVSFPSGGGEAFGFLTVPESGEGPGVVVIQEWWGLTTHIAEITRRLAAEGFVALAPDLYGKRTTHDAAEANDLLQQLPVDQAVRDLGGAVDFLLDLPSVTSSTVGAIGFCMGGAFVLRLAAAQGDRVSAAVPFYGLPGPEVDWSGVTAAVQGHYGRQDHSIDLDAVQQMADTVRKTARGPVEIHVYDAGHAFYNDENLIGTYDPAAAEQAWGRAVAFLREHVR